LRAALGIGKAPHVVVAIIHELGSLSSLRAMRLNARRDGFVLQAKPEAPFPKLPVELYDALNAFAGH